MSRVFHPVKTKFRHGRARFLAAGSSRNGSARARRRYPAAFVEGALSSKARSAKLLSRSVSRLQGRVRAPGDKNLFGIFHLAGLGAASPADFAKALFDFSAARGGPSARVVPIASTDYVTRVQRPLNSLLDCRKAAAVHGVTLPSWEDSLRVCVERFLATR